MKLAFAFAVPLLLAAGCLEGARDDDPPVATPPTVVRGAGMVTLSGPVLAIGSEATPFAVAPNVTLLYAEIVWDDEVQDIDLALASPSAGMTGTAQNYDHIVRQGSPGMPDSPHSLALVAPEPGEWQASAFGNGVAGMVEFRIAITMFHGETTVPDGYSGL
jgi:hypothetical protein